MQIRNHILGKSFLKHIMVVLIWSLIISYTHASFNEPEIILVLLDLLNNALIPPRSLMVTGFTSDDYNRISSMEN